IATAVGARVVAVEPLPANCGYLRRNVEANGLGASVTIWPVALAARVGSTGIYAEHGGVGNAALATLDQAPPRGPARLDGRPVTRVPVATLDELAAHVPGAADRRCCLVKMDVEGFELQVLQGGQRLLTSHRPVIWGEFERDYLEGRGESTDALTRWLADSGYRSYAVWTRRRGRLTSRYGIRLSPAALAGWSDAPGMLLVPAERPLAKLGLPTDLVEVAER
ncbi:MAG TPA: FkbM family methyltransferase, partial [Acidimicrobiales bacterium]|nr:FkbM family methyltransferase [Acidimicrobiales bacterium]